MYSPPANPERKGKEKIYIIKKMKIQKKRKKNKKKEKDQEEIMTTKRWKLKKKEGEFLNEGYWYAAPQLGKVGSTLDPWTTVWILPHKD